MKRTLMIPSLMGLVFGALSLAACATDKPANDASGSTTVTSARAPDGLESANANDTNATGAATNESPKSQPGVDAQGHSIPQNGSSSSAATNGQGLSGSSGSSSGAGNSATGGSWSNGNSGSNSGATKGSGASSSGSTPQQPPAGNNGNAAGSGQPGLIAPPPPAAGNNGSNLTPIDQGNNQTDLKITQQIRKAVVGDSSLSFTAKNVKIITVGGKVTLKGEVKTDAEKASIEATAIKTVGSANVDDEIVVKK